MAATHEEKREWTKKLTKAVKELPKNAPHADVKYSSRESERFSRAAPSERTSVSGVVGGGLAPPASPGSPGGDTGAEADYNWTEGLSSESDLSRLVVGRVAARFQPVAAAAAASAAGGEGADVGALLGAADECVDEMMRASDDFRPPHTSPSPSPPPPSFFSPSVSPSLSLSPSLFAPLSVSVSVAPSPSPSPSPCPSLSPPLHPSPL